MRKHLIGIITALTVAGGSIGCTSADTLKTGSGISVIYDGELLSFDVEPQIINDRTMVPMRTIFEQFGAKVKWDDATKTITAKKKSKTITMTVDSTEMTKNDEMYESDTAPQIVDDRTLVPVRVLSEMLGLDVEWDADTKTVNITTSEDEEDDAWKSNIGSVDLTALEVSGSGVSVNSNVITISQGGDFEITGTLADGMIMVDTEDKVKLRLSGASITNNSGAAIYFKNADKAYITLTENTENYLTSGESDETKGTVTSKDNLEIKGSGSLEITAANQGIHASDSLEISNGSITINAKGDGINVNDTAQISGGVVNITSESDGLQADEIVDISGGTLNITTTGEIASSDDKFGFPQRGTEENTSENDVSSKGIKADWMLEISGGDITLNTTDHAIHCTSEIDIKDGNIEIASSAGKGISGHGDVTIDNGRINITNATEGIETKAVLTVNDGDVHIVCTDDGLNAGSSDSVMQMKGDKLFGQNNDTANSETEDENRGNRIQKNTDTMAQPSGEAPQMNGKGEKAPAGGKDMMPPESENGEAPQMNGRGGKAPAGGKDMMPPESENGEASQMGGGRGGNTSTEISQEHHIQINGGYIYIDAKNDGIDSNGSIVIDGGTVVINASANSGNTAIDHDGLCRINGGTVIGAGAAGMIENPSDTSSQNVLSIYLSSEQTSGTPVSVVDESGNTLMYFKPSKNYSHLHFSSDKLETGKTYSVYVGGEYSGTVDDDGVGTGGKLIGGTADGEGNIEGILTTIGTASGRTGGMGGGRGQRMQ